jgi:hypothetical protein
MPPSVLVTHIAKIRKQRDTRVAKPHVPLNAYRQPKNQRGKDRYASRGR